MAREKVLSAQGVIQKVPGLPEKLREDLKASVESDEALKAAQEGLFQNEVFRALARTTQAITLVNGGVKVNALPEQAWAAVNHRIASDSSVPAVEAHDTELLKGLAETFNLSYTAFGVPVSGQDAPARSTLTLSEGWGSALEPAPVSPIDAPEYALLSGTIKATYNAHRNLTGDDNVVVAPSIMPWNTDSRWYWALSEHIYRYNHNNLLNVTAAGNGVHTINEFYEAGGFVEQIRFFTALILNADKFNGA